MSQIITQCPHCFKRYRVEPRLAGNQVQCKECAGQFEVRPATEDSTPAVSNPAPKFLPVEDASPATPQLDPLLPVPGSDPLADVPLPTMPPPATAAHAWQQRQAMPGQQKVAPFGGLERSCLALAVFLILLGIVLNLLPFFGTQVARFQGTGTLGQAAGLIMGLVGAGLLGFSLRKFKAASLIGGGASAAFVFVVFMASVLGGQRASENGTVVKTTPGEQERFTPDQIDVSGPWIGTYPRWEGFSEAQAIPPSPADRWRRIAVPELDISARFLGQPSASQARLRVNRQNVEVSEITATVQGQNFLLAAFRYPRHPGQSTAELLNDVESALDGIQRTESIELSGFPGRTYRVVDASDSAHGSFVLIDDDIVVHIRITGPSSRVPGSVSEKFISSLRIGDGGQATPRPVPDVQLDASRQARNERLLENVRKIENAMDSGIHPRCRMNFAPQYLTTSAGLDRGQRRFIVHPAKLPVIGIDLIEVQTAAGSVIANIAPIYDEATDSQSIMARDGYGLAAINVNADDWVEGVQFVFMKITPMGFNTGQSYTSRWYGTPPSGTGQRIGGDGRPVYGLWMFRSRYCKSLGLIRERN